MKKGNVGARCASCLGMVSPDDYCYGCGEMICIPCATVGAHGDSGHHWIIPKSIRVGMSSDTQLIKAMLEMIQLNEWQKRHAAENRYCPFCATDSDEWDDQAEHHAGCKYVQIERIAARRLSASRRPARAATARKTAKAKR